MFDTLLPEPAALRGADDATVVAAIEGWNRIEAAAGARRLDAIAELTSRRCDREGKRAEWACDGWDSAAAEVACALGVRHTKASSQMALALNLRRRLPQVAALYAEGKVSSQVVSAIAWHTDLVQDGAPVAAIDAALAGQAEKWGKLSDYKLAQAIDFWVDKHDPAAVRRGRSRARSRYLDVGDMYDNSDATSVFGRLYATDAQLLDRRLMELAHGVCEDDPRTISQRRADALGALAGGAERLACTCGDPECPTAGSDGRASNVVIHVVTEQATLDTQPDPHMSGTKQTKPITPNTTIAEAMTPDPEPDLPFQEGAKPPAGVLSGSGIVPAPLLAELINSGAKVRPVLLPGDECESGYRPSAALEEFIRVRDLTCRFPDCEVPAEFCDIDHTIPYPIGPTHPSNLKCVCRKHHLLKTFWTGIGGWSDRQLPDGTVIWTSPTGTTYTALPGSKIFFPAWDTTTTTLPRIDTPAAADTKGVMMPKRRRTRAADRARRIADERGLNAAVIVERSQAPPPTSSPRPPPTDPWDIDPSSLIYDDDPPPF